jgi:hypothetical protein
VASDAAPHIEAQLYPCRFPIINIKYKIYWVCANGRDTTLKIISLHDPPKSRPNGNCVTLTRRHRAREEVQNLFLGETRASLGQDLELKTENSCGPRRSPGSWILNLPINNFAHSLTRRASTVPKLLLFYNVVGQLNRTNEQNRRVWRHYTSYYLVGRPAAMFSSYDLRCACV